MEKREDYYGLHLCRRELYATTARRYIIIIIPR